MRMCGCANVACKWLGIDQLLYSLLTYVFARQVDGCHLLSEVILAKPYCKVLKSNSGHGNFLHFLFPRPVKTCTRKGCAVCILFNFNVKNINSILKKIRTVCIFLSVFNSASFLLKQS